MTMLRSISFLALLMVSQPLFGIQENDPKYELKKSTNPIELRLPFLAPAFVVEGKVQVAYELSIANNTSLELSIVKVEVFDLDAPTTALATLNPASFRELLGRPGIRSEDDELLRKLLPNQFAIIDIDVSLGTRAKHAKSVFHRVTLELKSGEKEPQQFTMEGAKFETPPITKLVIGPPVNPGLWMNFGSSHRRSRQFYQGVPTNAQRFACDLSKLSPDGEFARPNQEWDKNETWWSYGESILSVADGTVIQVVDGIRDNVAMQEEPVVKITRATGGGNSVFVDIGNGNYAFYAHLQPGSIEVKKGDRVKRGQKLGRLGNSGNSTGPHLHFHICTSADDPLAGEGMPFVFEKFTVHDKLTESSIDAIFEAGAIWKRQGGAPLKVTQESLFGDRVLELFE